MRFTPPRQFQEFRDFCLEIIWRILRFFYRDICPISRFFLIPFVEFCDFSPEIHWRNPLFFPQDNLSNFEIFCWDHFTIFSLDILKKKIVIFLPWPIIEIRDFFMWLIGEILDFLDDNLRKLCSHLAKFVIHFCCWLTKFVLYYQASFVLYYTSFGKVCDFFHNHLTNFAVFLPLPFEELRCFSPRSFEDFPH